MRQLGEPSDVGIDVIMVYLQVVKFCCGAVWFFCIAPQLSEFFFKVFIDHFVCSRRSRNEQNPVLCTLFPLINFRSIHVGEGVGDLLPWVCHDGVHGIHKLIKSKFMKEPVGLLSVSVEDGGFFSLKGFFIPSSQVCGIWEPRQRSRRWYWRRRSPNQCLNLLRNQCCCSELVSS